MIKSGFALSKKKYPRSGKKKIQDPKKEKKQKQNKRYKPEEDV
jgi:hypothetical protein